MSAPVPWVWRGAVRCALHGVEVAIAHLRTHDGQPIGTISFCRMCPPGHQLEWPIRVQAR